MAKSKKEIKTRWKPGVSGNPAGRIKGSKNSRTIQWETFKEAMMEGNLKRFQKELKKLEGKQYCDIVVDIMEFFKPRLARQVDKDGNDVKIEFVIKTKKP